MAQSKISIGFYPVLKATHFVPAMVSSWLMTYFGTKDYGFLFFQLPFCIHHLSCGLNPQWGKGREQLEIGQESSHMAGGCYSPK